MITRKPSRIGARFEDAEKAVCFNKAAVFGPNQGRPQGARRP
ncbi:hypothetical protein NBRC3257_1272 [Gluconobacter thailandicus NBRC 3257]|uniref:Transposase n=1 Tax=Gluconobacter thailandicus NBRC 3257 TaxID=1381097 RepID=A0ABQ0IVP4_GLUTH|nr:hypothetical protein B932_1182 [Gluconobacter oxydans H24]GAC89305.1 hypothetical protein NBRC3255_2966 [Gluconobacter thailandicus NBRC 3255]GAD26273.1 hypothetical protein NBRC3257_1272 [Gluconobacter thailandicus NBRC 3257]